jgi:hypothetical protein
MPLQDSLNGEDWQKDPAKMAEIYGNSFFTISAQNAGDYNDGFLDPRTQIRYPPFKLPYVPKRGDDLSWKKRYELGKETFVSAFMPALDNNFLSRRSWALQEFKLARRVLEYGPEEILLRIGGYAVSMLHVTICLVRDWSAYSLLIINYY